MRLPGPSTYLSKHVAIGPRVPAQVLSVLIKTGERSFSRARTSDCKHRAMRPLPFVPDEPQRPLYARAAEHNVGSHRVLARNGFVKIGEETSWADGAGKDVVEHIYRLD